MSTLDASYVANLSARLNKAFSNVEARRSVVIPTSVRAFLEALFLESVTVREVEWQTERLIDSGTPAGLARAEASAIDTMTSILDVVPTDSFGNVNYVALSSTVKQIHNRWCGVFPLCRK